MSTLIYLPLTLLPVSPRRRLHLRPLHRGHLRQRGPGGDGEPRALLPDGLQAKLHGAGLPAVAALHQPPGGVHGQPGRHPACSQDLPVQGGGAQRVRRPLPGCKLLSALTYYAVTKDSHHGCNGIVGVTVLQYRSVFVDI